eukprot:630668-Alexandrium_andersonii.AAC.1
MELQAQRLDDLLPVPRSSDDLDLHVAPTNWGRALPDRTSELQRCLEQHLAGEGGANDCEPLVLA